MGSSMKISNKDINASVGGLVWVRRRNGSWWPGRIVGLNELSEDCLVSPRSGTPVKLLGRDDASVDWYNLEKSKRVKAFRCGDYDECIEKAKVSAASSNKKAVKYARRDDAILHALEIENARLGTGRLDLRTRVDSSDGDHGSSAREPSSVSLSCDKDDGMDDLVSGSAGNSDSAQELSQSGISFEEPNRVSSSKEQSIPGRRRRTPNDSEDDGTGVKRMRGLEDLGVGVVSNRKAQSGGLLELAQQDRTSLSDSNIGLSDGSVVDGIKGNSLLKRKRTQVAHVHEFLKRKNRRRPLTKVLESTAMVSVPVICDHPTNSCGSAHQGLADGKASGLEESIESKKCLSSVINNYSDCTGFSCESGVSLITSGQVCDAFHITKKTENKNSSKSGLVDNASSDNLFEVPFAGEEKHSSGLFSLYMSCSPIRPELSELKRHFSQSSQADAAPLRSEKINGSVSTHSDAVHATIGQRIEKGTSKWQLKGKRNSRQISNDRKQDSRKSVNMDDEPNAYLAGRGQSDDCHQKVDCNGTVGCSDCSLEAKVKAVTEDHTDGFQDWSRMRGPMTDVKLLPDDSLIPQRSLPCRQSCFAVPSSKKLCSDAILYDVELEVKANYKSQHVPLVSLMSKLNGKAIVGHPLTVEAMDDGSCDIHYNSCMVYNWKGSEVGYVKPKSVGGRIPTNQCVMQTRHKSSKTKKSGLLSKKIRKLSSLTARKQFEERKAVAEKPKNPVISCIPLNLVFSRINKAANGSARQ